MSWPRRALHAAQRLVPTEPDGGVILCYHLVGGGTASPVDLPEPVFRRQMEELREHADVVALAEAARSPSSQSGRPRVAITFDDAYENFYRVAWPVLDELRLPATLFVPVGFLEGEIPAPIAATPALAPMHWEQLAELTATGRLTVGSHTWTHPDLRTLEPGRARVELRRSRQVLEERLGVAVRSFCYPRALWSRKVEQLVGEVYELATIGGGRRLRAGRVRPLRLERVSIRRDMPTDLAPVLRARVWLEEWLADLVRRLR